MASSPATDATLGEGARARDASGQDIATLYHEGNVTITPSWLTLDGRESYAVRAIVRVSLSRDGPPRVAAAGVAIGSLILVAIAFVHPLRDALPPAIAWTLLVASVALMLVAGHIAFMRPTDHILDVRLVDGTSVRLVRADRVTQRALHRALVRAMDYQQGGG